MSMRLWIWIVLVGLHIGSPAWTARLALGQGSGRERRARGGFGDPSAFFERLDSNGDGMITREELSADPNMQRFADRFIERSDLNGDGRITREEMTQASQQVRQRGGTGSSEGVGSGLRGGFSDGPGGNGTAAASSSAQAAASPTPDRSTSPTAADSQGSAGDRSRGGRSLDFASTIFDRYDRDQDGSWRESEIPESQRENLPSMDANRDGSVTKQEFIDYMTERFRQRQRERQSSNPSDGRSSGADRSRSTDVAAGESAPGTSADPAAASSASSAATSLSNSATKGASAVMPLTRRAPASAKSRVAANLPAWFDQSDANHDGQIGLYEWPRERLDEFSRYDLNDDGFIVPDEAARAARNGNTATADRSTTNSNGRPAFDRGPSAGSSRPPGAFRGFGDRGRFGSRRSGS